MQLQVTAGAKFAYGFSKVAATVFTVALVKLCLFTSYSQFSSIIIEVAEIFFINLMSFSTLATWW